MPDRRRVLSTALALATGAALLGACGTAGPEADGPAGAARAGGSASKINIGPDQHRVRAAKVPAIAAQVPARIRARGTLQLGINAGSNPPLGFYATDDKTLIGVETDIAHLVADTLGLRPEFAPLSWENLFVGLDSGKLDGVFSNVTVTEERKAKYDFATYRLDNLAVETKKGSGWKVAGARDVAGRTVAVSSGTNQEKILLDWSEENERAGRDPVHITYYQNASDYYLALQSGRIDAYFGPHPTAAYHAATSGQSEIAGTFSGGGTAVPGKIAATTKKGSGLVRAYAAALRHVIGTGQYGRVLARWGLSSEAVRTSEINPRGLPGAG
ncbi:ABC transporter substrate-binding protein [Streptomyces sp. NPDC007100]|uniref:ABC transporter substrate-binding protein n=1 Tax=unclassified Streptomyces TaxID=2593676 RepID=UPI0033E30831